MANFPTQIPDYESDCPAVLDLFISFGASICSTMAFHPVHCIAYDYSCANWVGLCDHLRDVP